MIDRTNLDAKQRESWVAIATAAGATAQAVLLDVTPALCMERVKTRTEHYGSQAKPFIVNMMKGRLRAPTAEEGFSQVETVSTPQDVAEFVTRV